MSRLSEPQRLDERSGRGPSESGTRSADSNEPHVRSRESQSTYIVVEELKDLEREFSWQNVLDLGCETTSGRTARSGLSCEGRGLLWCRCRGLSRHGARERWR